MGVDQLHHGGFCMRQHSRQVDLGLRRVDWVRIVVEARGARAEVQGVRHRRPVTLPVSLGVAGRLVAGGARLVVHHRGGVAASTVEA